MSRSPKILLAYDGSAFAAAALEDLAHAGLPSVGQARVLSFVDVRLPPVAFLPGEAEAWYAQSLVRIESQAARARKDAAALSEKAAARLRKILPAWKVTAHGVVSDAAAGILDAAARWKPSLIVMGTHGRTALKRMLLGSVSHSVLGHADSAVRVARDPGKRKAGPLRVLIAVDGSKEAEAALTTVSKRTWSANTVFRVVVVAHYPVPVPDIAGEALMLPFRSEWKDAARRVAEKGLATLARQGRRGDYKVREGDPRTEIVREAARFKADSLFIGSHAHGALRRFLLGSTSRNVAEHAPCTVEVVK